MKKLNKLMVFVAALFVGIISVNAKFVLTKNNCLSGTDDPNPQTCPVQYNLTGSTIKTGKTLTIIFYEPNNIKENTITIQGNDGWKVKKVGDTEYKSSISLDSFGENGVFIQFKYEGTEDIAIGNDKVLANVVYDKEDTGVGCGFNFGMPLCSVETINNKVVYFGIDSNVLEDKKAWEDECTCKKIGDRYVGLDGQQVKNNDPKELVKECFVCEEVEFDNQTYFVGNNKVIHETKDEMLKDCFVCKVVDGKYYNSKGQETTEDKYYTDCFSCLKPGEKDKTGATVDKYYGKDGKPITGENAEEEYKNQCEEPKETPICRVVDGKYYGKEGKEITAEEYKKICMCRIETTKEGKIYYNDKNEEITAEQYKNQCEPPVPTGASIPSVMILGGLLAATSMFFIIRNKTKFRKI